WINYSTYDVVRFIYCRIRRDVPSRTYLGLTCNNVLFIIHFGDDVITFRERRLRLLRSEGRNVSELKVGMGSKIMDLNKKFTPETWPEKPELATFEGKNKFIGFWLFLGGEVILFATLVATYLALKNKGPADLEFTTQELYELPLGFVMTMLLLTSSLTSVYAMYHLRNFNFRKMQLWLGFTAFLGLGFLIL